MGCDSVLLHVDGKKFANNKEKFTRNLTMNDLSHRTGN